MVQKINTTVEIPGEARCTDSSEELVKTYADGAKPSHAVKDWTTGETPEAAR